MILLHVALWCWLVFDVTNLSNHAFTVEVRGKNSPKEVKYGNQINKRKPNEAINVRVNHRKYPKVKIEYRKPKTKQTINIHLNQKSPRNSKLKRIKSQPVNVSFQPLGALKMNSLTEGQIEINFEAFGNHIGSMAADVASQITNLPQYLTLLSGYFNGDESAVGEHESEELSHDVKKHSPEKESFETEIKSEENNSETDVTPAEKDSSAEEPSLEEENNKSTEQSSSKPLSKESEIENQSADESTPAHSEENTSREEEDEKSSEKETTNSSEENKSKSDTKDVQNSEEKKPGILEKFQNYYSYAKPIANMAMMVVPGLGQYRQAMFAMEMIDLAHETSKLYTEEKSYLSIGWFLGKEAFKRLGRRGETSQTSITSKETQTFFETIQSTQYPLLDDEKEAQLKQNVEKIVNKYFHDDESFQNITRTGFIDLMTLSVKFIALKMIESFQV